MPIYPNFNTISRTSVLNNIFQNRKRGTQIFQLHTNIHLIHPQRYIFLTSPVRRDSKVCSITISFCSIYRAITTRSQNPGSDRRSEGEKIPAGFHNARRMRSRRRRRRRKRRRSRSRLVSPHRLRIQFPSLAGVYRAGRVMSSILIGWPCAHANHVEEGRRSAAAKYSRIHERAASTGWGVGVDPPPTLCYAI